MKNNSSKLNTVLVKEIRQKLREGVTAKVIAYDYGISLKTVSQIKRGETWKGIGE